ncbi:hypothetical protein [Nocardioides mesophilus]|uniref:Uncharacterized protein n=1 Tax=Nocardioides mesophilus TaxID=433659 RepID=A0A7G9REE6_9ACTN|nr:hypothetical protein [Nocardioides mesophilus]QNN53971.1 hypothetical protein H9L09_06200 [Nocardioides mesophilus]
MTRTGALLRALGLGVAGGLLARLLMRLVTLVRDEEPSFTLVATAAITTIFVLSAVGAATAGLLPWHWLLRVAVLVVTSFLMAVGAIAIGISELQFVMKDDLTTGQWVAVVGCAAGIWAISAAMPWIGYRWGRRARSRRTTLAAPATA